MFGLPNRLHALRNEEIVQSLWRLQKIILDSLDFNTVTNQIVNGLLKELGYLELGYRIIVLTLLDEERQILKRITLSSTEEAARALAASAVPFNQIDIPLTETNNYLVKTLNSKEVQITSYWPDIFRPILTKEQALNNQNAAGIKTSMLYPIIVRDKAIGVLIFSLVKDYHKVTAVEKELLSGFTDIVGLAVQNSRLYTARQESLKKLSAASQELKIRNKNLQLLHKMSSIITTTLDVEEVCSKVVDTLVWELGHDIAYISLYDEKTNSLTPQAFSRSPYSQNIVQILVSNIKELTISLEETDNLIVQAYKAGDQLTSSSIDSIFRSSSRELASETLKETSYPEGIIIYPIKVKNNVTGVLVVLTTTMKEDQSKEEKAILSEFVKEVGIALDNALLYQGLKATNQKLIELDQMKDEFVSIASHELRTPMTAINSYVWMALNKGGALPPKAKDYLDKVAISTQRMIALVEDMLSVSRIESGRIKLEPTSINLCDLVKDVHEEIMIKAKERNQTLEFTCNAEGLNAWADLNKVREVITNLVSNAIKFTEVGGKVWTEVYGDQTSVTVSVSDTGRGIAKEDLPRLFTKFGRIENSFSTVAQTQGTGLGLYICKKYIEAMGGQIGAESEAGKGSRFWFTLRRG